MGVYVPYLQICFDLLFSKCDVLSLIRDNFGCERKKHANEMICHGAHNARLAATKLHDTKCRKTPARFFNFTSYIF